MVEIETFLLLGAFGDAFLKHENFLFHALGTRPQKQERVPKSRFLIKIVTTKSIWHIIYHTKEQSKEKHISFKEGGLDYARE